MNRPAVIFGGGNVGRGLLGQVFSDADLPVLFVDIDPDLLAALHGTGEYAHVTVNGGRRKVRRIGPVDAIPATDDEAIAAALADAAVVATCVGARVLPGLARQLAPLLEARLRSAGGTLNILIAENLHDAARLLRGWLVDAAPGLLEAGFDERVGLVSTSIGRMIPTPAEDVRELGAATIEVEPYQFLPIDGAALVGDLPDIPAVVIDSSVPFSYYSDRKLFLHNMGHAMTAYLGACCGDTYVWQTIEHTEIRALVRAAMTESAVALAWSYRQPVGPLLAHIDDLLHRFGNRALGDTVERVARDPERKLAPGDRLMGAYALCRAHLTDPRHIEVGIAAGLCALAAEKAWDEATVAAWVEAQGLDGARILALTELLPTLPDSAGIAQLLDDEFKRSRIP